MNKYMHQIATLTAFGNAYLAGKNTTYHKSNPGAYNYRNIRFLEKQPSKVVNLTDIFLKDPNDWYKFLKKEKSTRLFLSYHSDSKIHLKTDDTQKSAQEWGIVVQKGSNFDLWDLKTRAERGEAISYYYPTIKNGRFDKNFFPTLETVIPFLNAILKDMIDFTKRNKLKNWIKVFTKAKKCLAIKESELKLDEGYLPNDCFSVDAKRVIATCDYAWVFGGMGSWNDVTNVDDYDLYRRLTTNLYDTICKSLASAINSYPEY